MFHSIILHIFKNAHSKNCLKFMSTRQTSEILASNERILYLSWHTPHVYIFLMIGDKSYFTGRFRSASILSMESISFSHAGIFHHVFIRKTFIKPS